MKNMYFFTHILFSKRKFVHFILKLFKLIKIITNWTSFIDFLNNKILSKILYFSYILTLQFF